MVAKQATHGWLRKSELLDLINQVILSYSAPRRYPSPFISNFGCLKQHLIMDIEKCISLTCNDKAISLFVAVDSHCICHSMEYYFHFLIRTVHTNDSQIFCGPYFETTCTRRAIPCENV